MTRLYVVIGLLTAFDLSTEVGYLALAAVAVHLIHNGMHHSHKGK